MQILSKATSWVQRQVATPGDDFREAPREKTPTDRLKLGAGIGAGVGAVVGGGAAYHEISNDSVYFDYETSYQPLASSGPSAAEMFGGELAEYQSLVSGQSESAASGEQSLQYLSYFKFQNPKISTEDVQGIYKTLEGQLGDDTKVRDALNMISAHVDRHGTTHNEAHQEFSNYFGYQSDFEKATQTFLADQKLTEQELNAASVQMVKKHTSPIGHLGMVKSVTLGIAAGAAVGAATGLAVGVGVNLYTKLVNS